MKNAIGNLIVIALNPWVTLGSIVILTILILPIQEHGISLHLFVSSFISKITADGDCSHEPKRCLLLGRKVMTNLDSIYKSRDLLCQQSRSSQGYGFSNGHVWMR